MMRPILFLAAFLLFLGCPAPEPEPPDIDFAEYHSDTYGFTIQYPDTLAVREYTPEHLEIGREVSDDFYALVQVGLYHAYPDEPAHGPFDAFAQERARMLCAADGPGMSADCTDVTRTSGFSTEEGLEGYRFHLRHETVDLTTTEVVESSTRGPFVAIDVSTQVPDSPMAALLIHPPIVMEPDEVDEELVRSVAENVRLVALTPSPEPAEQYAFIHDVLNENDEHALVVDFVEWVDDPDSPRGFRIENPFVLLDTLPLASDAVIQVLGPPANARPGIEERIPPDQFRERFEEDLPYRLDFRGPQIVGITEMPAP